MISSIIFRGPSVSMLMNVTGRIVCTFAYSPNSFPSTSITPVSTNLAPFILISRYGRAITAFALCYMIAVVVPLAFCFAFIIQPFAAACRLFSFAFIIVVITLGSWVKAGVSTGCSCSTRASACWCGFCSRTCFCSSCVLPPCCAGCRPLSASCSGSLLHALAPARMFVAIFKTPNPSSMSSIWWVFHFLLLKIQKYLHFCYQYLYLSFFFSILWKVDADKDNVVC